MFCSILLKWNTLQFYSKDCCQGIKPIFNVLILNFLSKKVLGEELWSCGKGRRLKTKMSCVPIPSLQRSFLITICLNQKNDTIILGQKWDVLNTCNMGGWISRNCLLSKIQLRCLEWNESLLADWLRLTLKVIFSEIKTKPSRHLNYFCFLFSLACHYDTLKEPIGFVGAIDSAVPCSIILDLAQKLTPFLK